ncbi:hypothetical protein SLS62_000572 [Diatrype stigma]|uniref:Uncharacterized protein n=1 Tax=Diatrype stigma TaxID=117547 RepID=A0AAN9V1X1_9PEZI
MQDLVRTESSDLESPDFFSSKFHFIDQATSNGDVNIRVNKEGDGTTLQSFNDNDAGVDIWNEVDQYGKAYYSTILADLGQSNGPNLLLPEYEATLSKYSETIETLKHILNAEMGPAKHSYTRAKALNETGPLAILPSTIYSQYLCQVAQLKPPLSLTVAILVADLVFLRALWSLTTAAVTWMVERNDSSAMHCVAHCGGPCQAEDTVTYPSRGGKGLVARNYEVVENSII